MPFIIIKIRNTLLFFLIFSSFLNLTGCTQSKKLDKVGAAGFNAELGAKYLHAGRIELANQKLKKALEQNPNSSNAHHYYALLQQRIGRNKKATQHFKTAIGINSDDPNLLNNYGSHLCKLGHYNKAIIQFNKAANNPFYKTPEFAYSNSGICLRKVKKDQQAETYFRKALTKNPNFGSALFEMAKLNYDQRNFPKAQAFLLRYDEKNPVAPESLSLCSKINTALGNLKTANACSEKKLRLFGNK
ncbi:MAG: type IV pilus biogenesis/stability protein PilW [Cocleimonas sp.]|nr:type IV pilus biogenesis/stability protein PilW [Cocleimonas sp.]